MVAGEGPVARRGTRGEGRDPWQGPARAFLVDEEFDRLTEHVGDDGPGGGDRNPGQARRVTAPQGGPRDAGQEQAQEDQRALARRFQGGLGPRRPVRHALRQRLVSLRRVARGDVHRCVRAQSAAWRQPDHGRCPCPGRHDGHRYASTPSVPIPVPVPVSVSLDRIHGAHGRNTAGRAPWPNGSSVPRRSSGLTGTGPVGLVELHPVHGDVRALDRGRGLRTFRLSPVRVRRAPAEREAVRAGEGAGRAVTADARPQAGGARHPRAGVLTPSARRRRGPPFPRGGPGARSCVVWWGSARARKVRQWRLRGRRSS